MNEQKGKKFVFPENVESGYGIFLGITLRELAIYLLPPVVIGFIILALPPHNVWLMLFKLMLILIVLIMILAFLSSRPIRYRKNIRFQDYLKLRTNYKQRQKLFYTRRKKERFFR
ncbi:conjugal transfer protein [Sporosarcina sp. PTS2304]|uniref:conjugal transfer protein n=1 Tax=Sporosarcina sp. PTS2304 TaxID=2283194 RepID=UPI000E0DB841|nr:conjugal transfer protein [Sporosarcina sp. PTS2304]AXI00568.1 conjugal transfer protein [Sporosarcina sp. PTS2304]